MPRDLTPDDVEQLRHVAQDADGIPLSAEDLAFLASAEQDALRVDDYGDLFVVTIGGVRYYRARQVRAAIADARAVWAVITRSGRAGGPGL